ncbi:4'-phosphopantetheinyl transferase superfamily protein [Gramella sp. GC03-9]|uniref:4'-phosphopantetheinyl transferase superfamily protein n=1 Tax=Christiangramia oceanisediminis TaxID=2920386 RepID=A0A9X2KY16_9FLAO|nr:4'-phosphopantetheinyl transferase superfamily protein [Gramella oceanisediminis]MCP9200413.1 4'-phosphopantetheinyl transferase superfamily protein [Gramella oceanisediminis]
MIGNDLVDLNLALPEKKAKNLRYQEKVFLAGEIDEIKASLDPERSLWRFWSMKECAYKASQRDTRFRRKLNPLDFKCEIQKDSTGLVHTKNATYKVYSEIESNYIHSYTISESFRPSVIYHLDISKQEKLAAIAAALGLSKALVNIEKDSLGIPCLRLGSTPKSFPISMSHHGNFSAFLIPLINS